MIDTLKLSGEFEQKPNHETEKKYLPLFPEALDELGVEAMPVEQLYLSHPNEPFSLRLRETFRDGELHYQATLKDRGDLTPDGLERLEIETEISRETYLFYKNKNPPVLKKLRATPNRNISIDWFEDGHIQVESEHPISWAAFLDQQRLSSSAFIDLSGDRFVDNEWRAHLEYRKRHSGTEAYTIPPELDTTSIAHSIWCDTLASEHPIIVTIAGRSGSGKTTAINEIQEELRRNQVESIVLSTDDYHRGKSWLEAYQGGEWTEWDAPIVYDVIGLTADLERLQNGETIEARGFDFATEEPVTNGIITPQQVILVEGIYARHPLLRRMAHSRHELATPLATCIGRRLLRDLKERPQFSDATRSLRYALEQAEPAYRSNLSPGE